MSSHNKENTGKVQFDDFSKVIYSEESWANSENAFIYEKMPLHYFQDSAVNAGLDNGCDVKEISNYIMNAKRILEVGAGYGRVLNSIISSGFRGGLVAVEREPKLCQMLEKIFADKVQVFCADIRNFKPQNTFDLILWMWVGITEFSRHEQLSVLARISNFLNKKGFFIFDIIPIEYETTNAAIVNINASRNYRVISTPYGSDYCYYPTPAEIDSYVQLCGLRKVKVMTYKTKTNRIRQLYITQKCSFKS
jgi:SAM-dependent methyltransferase